MLETAFFKFLVVSGVLLAALAICVVARLSVARYEEAALARRNSNTASRRRGAIWARNATRRATVARCNHAGFGAIETHTEIERGVCSVCGPYVRQTRTDRWPFRW